MRKLLWLCGLLGLFVAEPAMAATVFWSPNVTGGGGASCNNGTFNWDADAGTAGAAHKCWATATGGTTAAAAPGSADTATFDTNSGGGSVLLTINQTLATLTWGAFTGTLSLGSQTLTVTTQFSGSGTGIRTFNCATGTINLNTSGGTPWSMLTTTNLTFTCTTGTVNFNTTTAGGLNSPNFFNTTIGTLTFAPTSGAVISFTGNSNTFTTLTLAAPAVVQFPVGTTTVGTLNCTGTSTNLIGMASATVGTAATISVASGSPTCAWASIRDMTFTGGATFASTNSFDLKHNSGITITAPTGGGGGGGFVGLLGGGI